MNRWNTPGIPHKDWTCIEVEDLEDAVHTCEMCGQESIRYVHHMWHDASPNLKVGCVCAEKMAQGYDGKAAEARVRNRASRRKTFVNSGWKRSKNGNFYRKKNGSLVVVGEGQYGVFASVDKRFLRGKFTTIEAAMVAAFNEIDPG